MSTFICGDIQSCFDSFINVLEKANYCNKQDRLILAGDLVNRGPQSLETIDWIYKNRNHLEIVLGNHDLHFIAVFYGLRELRSKDTLKEILNDSMAESYVDWLCQQPFIIEEKDFLVCHAGLYPYLKLEKLRALSEKAHTLLKNKESRQDFLKSIFNEEKLKSSFSLCADESEEINFFVAAVTRMRCIKKETPHELDFSFSGELKDIPEDLQAWQAHYDGKRLYHGHWAALGFKVWANQVISLDSGCVWGNEISLYEHEKNKLFQASR